MSVIKFDRVWEYLQHHLRRRMVIRNWTMVNGYYGEDFYIEWVSTATITVDPPGAMGIQHIPKDDFQAIWGIWPAYLSGRFPRGEMSEMTRFSKYIISILHWYEEKVSHA